MLKTFIFKKRTLTEEELIEGCKAGKESYVKILYEKNYSMYFRICSRYFSDSEQVKDVVQEGFIKIVQHLSSFEYKGSFEGWMKRVIVTTALNSLKAEKKHAMNLSIHDEGFNERIHHENLIEYERVAENFSYKEVIQLIEELPELYKAVFKLKVVEGYNHKEISELLNITEVNSRALLNKARKKLQEVLKKNVEGGYSVENERTQVI